MSYFSSRFIPAIGLLQTLLFREWLELLGIFLTRPGRGKKNHKCRHPVTRSSVWFSRTVAPGVCQRLIVFYCLLVFRSQGRTQSDSSRATSGCKSWQRLKEVKGVDVEEGWEQTEGVERLVTAGRQSKRITDVFWERNKIKWSRYLAVWIDKSSIITNHIYKKVLFTEVQTVTDNKISYRTFMRICMKCLFFSVHRHLSLTV